MARVDPPKRDKKCPGCKGLKTDTESKTFVGRRQECGYCDGIGKVTEHKYKTILRYFRSDPNLRKRLPNGATLH